MEHRTQAATIERRYFCEGIELRSLDKGGQVFRGYALKFDVSYDMGWFTESVSRTALNSADMKDVRILFNHNPDNLLGRTTAGTARVGIDEVGMWYEWDYDESDPDHVRMKKKVDKREVTQSSWGFFLRFNDDTEGDQWDRRNGKAHRTLTDVEMVFDASPVTFPANPDTSIAARSLAMYVSRGGDISEQRKQEIEEKLEIKTPQATARMIEAALALH